MPVTFLNHLYGIQQLKVVDSASRSPTSMGTSTPSAGAASCTFTGWSALETGTSTAAPATSDDIVYPVSMAVKLPKRFEKERVKFHFNAIPLPEPTPKLR
jgi:hypothetical protein